MKTSSLISLVASALVSYAVSSCTLASVCLNGEQGGYTIEEDYDTTKFVVRELNMTDFDIIDAHGYAIITYTQSDEYRVVAKSTEEIFAKTKLFTQGSKLVLDQREAKVLNAPVLLTVYAPDVNTICSGGYVKFVAGKVNSTRDFSFDISGAGSVEVGALTCANFVADMSGATKIDGKINAHGEAKLDFSGATKADIDVSATKLNADCSGAVKLSLNYTGEDAFVDCSGACYVNMGFTGNSVVCDCSGASKIESTLHCKELSVDLSGASAFKASGIAEKTQFETSGVSSIDTKNLNAY